MKLLVGTAGWSYKDWVGVFYPKTMKPKHYLAYYAKFFDYTEVNSTFYNLPNEAVVRKWARDVPDRFRFTIKLWKNISHKKIGVEGAIDAFFARMRPLEAKIKGYLLQFPPQFNYSEKHYQHLNHLLERLVINQPIFVELRDNAWFKPEIIKSFVGDKVVLVTNYKEGVQPIYWENQSVYYIRLIGDRELTRFNRIQRSQDEILDEVKRKLDSWERQPGIREVLITFNNHFRGFSPQDANEFREAQGLPFQDFKASLQKEAKKQHALTDYF